MSAGSSSAALSKLSSHSPGIYYQCFGCPRCARAARGLQDICPWTPNLAIPSWAPLWLALSKSLSLRLPEWVWARSASLFPLTFLALSPWLCVHDRKAHLGQPSSQQWEKLMCRLRDAVRATVYGNIWSLVSILNFLNLLSHMAFVSVWFLSSIQTQVRTCISLCLISCWTLLHHWLILSPNMKLQWSSVHW